VLERRPKKGNAEIGAEVLVQRLPQKEEEVVPGAQQ
jgi:hypothetical protein